MHCLDRLGIDPDADAVLTFQALATVNLQLKKDGPSVPTLVRKALLEHGLGDFAAARLTSERALEMEAGNQEALYVRALACMGLALLRSGLVPGPCLPTQTTQPGEATAFWLHEAAFSLRRLLLEGEDAEARELLADIDDFVEKAKAEAAGLSDEPTAHPVP